MTTALAAYAALVSTVAIGWEIISWLWGRRTRLEVVATWRFPVPIPGREPSPLVEIAAINHSDYPVTVHEAGFKVQYESGMNALVFPVFDSNLTGTIPGRNRVAASCDLQALMQHGLNPDRPVVAEVRTATGQTFRSKPTNLFDSHQDDSGDHDHEPAKLATLLTIERGVVLNDGVKSLSIVQPKPDDQQLMISGTTLEGAVFVGDSIVFDSEAVDVFVQQLQRGADEASVGQLPNEQLFASRGEADELLLEFRGPRCRFVVKSDRESLVQALAPLMATPESHGLGQFLPPA